MEVGISTGFYYEQDLAEALAPIAEAGFPWVEIWAGPHKWKHNYVHFNWHEPARRREVRRILSDLKLNVWSLHCPYSPEMDTAHPDEAVRRAAADEVLASLEVAAELGARFAVFHPSSAEWDSRNGAQRRERMEALHRSVEEIVERAWHLGVAPAMENLLPHLFGGEPEVLLETLGRFGPEDLVACFDSSHANLWKQPTVYEICSRLGPRIQTVHLSDNFQEHDDHFLFGRGTIHWPRLLGCLKETGYDGILMCEAHGEAKEGDPREKLSAIRRKAAELADLYERISP